jgi:AcrR family transcriptional regulator
MEPTERRRQLLLTGKKVFAECGYHATGVADIVESAAVARGTFYLYFKSKRDIFGAVLDYIFQSLMEHLQSIPADQPEMILKGIIDNLANMQAFFEGSADEAMVIIREAMLLDEESARRVDDMRKELVEWLREILVHWQKAGILRPLDPDLVAHAFIGSTHNLFEQRVLKGQEFIDSEQIVPVLLDLFLFGLVAPEHFQLAEDHLKEIGDTE